MALGVVSSLGFLGGCAPAPATPAVPAAGAPAPAAGAQAPPKEAAQRGGVLQFGIRQEGRFLFPWKGEIVETQLSTPVYETLLRYDHRFDLDYRIDFEVFPHLARRWEQPAENVFSFELQQGVKWHDGRDFTADDVVWSLNDLLNPQNPYPRAGVIQDVKQVEKLDSHRVRVTLEAPSADFLSILALPSNQVFILPKHLGEQGANFEKVMIGTGPMKLRSADLKSVVVYERNDNYWQAGKPYLDGAHFFLGREQAAMQAALAAKEMDFLNVGDKAQFDGVMAAVPGLQSTSYVQTLANHLYPRQDRPPFNDIRVRRALNLGIDRPAMLKTLTFDRGVINPPGGVGFKKGWGISQEELSTYPGWRLPKEQDLAEARKLLADAGFANGLKTSISATRQRSTSPPIGEAASGQLHAIGIDAELNFPEHGVYLKAEASGDYEIAMVLGADAIPFNERLVTLFHSKGSLNKVGPKDAKLDDSIERLGRTMDAATRKKLVYDIQKTILDNVYAIPTVDLATFALWQPWLKSYALCYCAQAYGISWTNMWFDPQTAPKRTLR